MDFHIIPLFPPHLLILDIMMPDIKGYEVCKKIKENPQTKDTKIIVLSAYLDEEKFKKMKEHGADIDPDQFAHCIHGNILPIYLMVICAAD